PPGGGSYRGRESELDLSLESPVASAFRRNSAEAHGSGFQLSAASFQQPASSFLPPASGFQPSASSFQRSASAVPLVAETKRESPWGARFAVMTGIALVIASIVFLTLASGNRTAIAAARPANAPAAEGTAKAGLELLSLRDSRTPGTLTITGM